MSMYLDEIRNVILLFSNPSWKGVGTVSSTVIRNITALSGEVAYSARFSGNTTVLSSRYAAEGIISGLLYVPDLPGGHSCTIETAPHIPATAARRANLPPTNYRMIAIAPWVNGRCADAYLDAARNAPVRAFLFYRPGTWAVAPPPARSDQWHIHGSSDWMSQTAYPVFAVSGAVGEIMMQHSSLYSGNLTEVPYGEDISKHFPSDPEDYLRIWTELTIGTTPTGFATWVYLLIVLGVLFTVVAATSLLMHLAQAWRRASLRRRVIAGEINLEAMGIRHLTVPMAHIQSFPLFTYCYEPDACDSPLSPRSPRSNRPRGRKQSLGSAQDAAGAANANRDVPPARASFSSELGAARRGSGTIDPQPTCEICLEHFVNRETIIRELPCGHIFHPECIDPFLSDVSSLCPVCKASMLPPGYCPRITNDMVRRERAVRRLRGRVDDDVVHESDSDRNHRRRNSTRARRKRRRSESGEAPTRWIVAVRKRVFGGWGRRDPPQPPPLSGPPLSTESKETPPGPSDLQAPSPEANSQGGEGRGSRVRERMRELAGLESEHPPEGSSRVTRWKRIRTRVFPGF